MAKAVKDRDYRSGTKARIKGPGTTTSDDIPAMLSKGEFVIKASSAAKIGDKALNHMNKTGRVPMDHSKHMMSSMKTGRMRGKKRMKFNLGGAAKLLAGAALAGGAYKLGRKMFGPSDKPAAPAAPTSSAPNPNQGGVATPNNQGATDRLEQRMRKAGMATGGKVKAFKALTKRDPEDARENGYTTYGFAKGGKMGGLRSARRR